MAVRHTDVSSIDAQTDLIDELEGLHLLARVVEARSFAEAARRAGTTTSAISKSLSRLQGSVSARARLPKILHEGCRSRRCGRRSTTAPPVRFRVPASLVPILANSSRWGRIKAEIVCAMSSKYAIALYELVQLRANMERCIEPFALDRFRDLLGVSSGAYERGNDFIKRVIDPAVLEVNGLSEDGVKVDVDRAYSRAPITGITLGWLKKEPDTYRATHAERQRSELGRMARLKGTAAAQTLPLTERVLTLLPKRSSDRCRGG